MENLDDKDTILKMKKTKPQIKKELKELIANGRRNENTDKQEKTNRCTANEEDAVKDIQEFEEIIKNNKSDTVWLAYYQGKIFQKFKEKKTIC